MKQICDIVEDLLFLYEEGECSEGSREFVEEHLKDCEKCNKIREKMRLTDKQTVLNDDKADNAENKAISKGFRKIKRRWVISIIAVLMICPIVGMGILISNEIRKEGMCFSNMQEIAVCRKWVKLLEEKKFEEAARMVDYSKDYESILEAYEYHQGEIANNTVGAEEEMENFMEYYGDEIGMTLEEYEAARVEDFVNRLSVYTDEGNSVHYRSFNDAYISEGKWHITLSIEENNSNYSLVTFCVQDDNLYGVVGTQGNGYLTGGVLGRVNFEGGAR